MANPRIYYDNRFDDGAIIATAADAGTAGENIADWRAYTFYRPASLPATITVDCGAAKSADYVLIAAHDLFSKGCTVEVRASTDGFVSSNVLVQSIAPTSDAPLLRHFSSVSYRHWRLLISGGASMPSIGIAAIGMRFELPGYLGADFDPTGRRVVAQSNANLDGQPLGKVIEYTQQRRSVRMRFVDPAWIRSTFLPAWREHLRSMPFGFAWHVGIDSANVVIATAGDDLRTPHFPGGYADIEFDLINVVDD